VPTPSSTASSPAALSPADHERLAHGRASVIAGRRVDESGRIALVFLLWQLIHGRTDATGVQHEPPGWRAPAPGGGGPGAPPGPGSAAAAPAHAADL
jgi:hypothetical protein